MLSFRAPAILFLKATTTTTITVPGYTRKDGTFVPPHQKVVHINPDKSKSDVLAGKGSHSQKVAHSKLSKLPGWGSMSEDEQHAHILSWATNYQQKQSAAAAVSGWKAAVLAGKVPTKSQQEAFLALNQQDPLKAAKLIGEASDAIGAGKLADLLDATGVPAKPEPAASVAETAAAAEGGAVTVTSTKKVSDPLEGTTHVVTFSNGATATLIKLNSSESMGLPGWHDAGKVGAPSSAGGSYLADTKEEAIAMLLAKQQAEPADGGTLASKPDPSSGAQAVEPVAEPAEPAEYGGDGAQTAPSPFPSLADHDKADAENEAAAAQIDALVSGTGGHYPVKAAKAITAKLKEDKEFLAEWAEITHVQRLQIIVDLAKEYQAAASASAAVSGWKKAAHAGKNPTPAQWKAFYALPAGKKAAMLQDVHAAAGGTGHLVAPALPNAGAPDVSGLVDDEKPAAAAPDKPASLRLLGKKYTKSGDDWVSSSGSSHAPGTWRHTALSVLNGDPVSPAVSNGARQVALDALLDGEFDGHGISPEKALNALYPPSDQGPQEGDTKVINGVTYVLQGGRWHKQGVGELPDGAKAIIDQLSAAGDAPSLQSIVNNGLPLAAAYAAQKLAEMQSGASASPSPSDGQSPGVVGSAGLGDAGGDQGAQTGPDVAGQPADWDVFHNTEPGHNKFWAVSVVGDSMVTHYGKIGTAGSTTVKHFAKPGAALAAASKLQQQKMAKGYKFKGSQSYPVPGDAKPALKPASATVKPKPAIESADGWQQTGPQGGSNPGGRFKDPSGQEWYIKTPATEAHAKNELLAAKLYEAAGVKVPELKLVMKDGKTAIASKWVDGMLKAEHPDDLAIVDGALSGFAVDAWLANWDVTGLGLDNLLMDQSGKAVRIDVGGSLLFRAQGEPKGAAFGDDVSELQSLMDPKKNPLSAALFGGMSKAAAEKSAERVLAISDSAITDLVQQFGPGTQAERDALAQKLIARKASIAKAFPGAKQPAGAKSAPKPKLDQTALPVNPNDLPPYHDFHNWNGPGKGLSSKQHINDANLKAEKDLHDFALQGNLVALKDYHFDAIDKETGEASGKLPIAQHPSQHVKLYHSDLVQYLDAIANPPEPLRVSEGNDPTQFKAEKLGKTISTVQANKKLGFWVALGKLVKAEPFVNFFAGKEKMVSEAYKSQAKSKGIDHLPKLARRFINQVQSSGTYNDYFRDGHDADSDGYSTAAIAAAAYAAATEKPAGTTIYRWQNMTDAMVKQILAAKPGLVFQNPGSMCASMSPTATKGFGKHRMVIHYAEGAKAVDSFASGSFKGEQEITTLMGQRFMLLRSEMSNNLAGTGKKGLEIHVLMLPPDPDYVADLQQRAATTTLKKSFRAFNELMGNAA